MIGFLFGGYRVISLVVIRVFVFLISILVFRGKENVLLFLNGFLEFRSTERFLEIL